MGSGICCGRQHIENIQQPSSDKITLKSAAQTETPAYAKPSAAQLDRLKAYLDTHRETLPRKAISLFSAVLENSHREQREVSIRLVSLGTVGARSLAVLLPYYSHITSLKLWKTKLGTEGVVLLAAELPKLTELATLGLEDNAMAYEGVVALARALPSLLRLQELWLPVNAINAKGAQSLAPALRLLRNLTAINLDENSIEAEGLQIVLSSLHSRTGLNSLSVAYNSISSACTPYLLDFIKTCPANFKLNLSGNRLSPEDQAKLAHSALQVLVKS